MTKELYTLSFIVIACLGIVSTLFVKYKLIPNKFLYPCMFFLVILAFLLTFSSKPNLFEIGFISFTFIDVMVYGSLTLTVCFLLYFLNRTVFKQPPLKNIFIASPGKIFFYVILSAPTQEFLFRSFVHYSLDTIGMLNVLFMTAISSVLFGIAHLGLGDNYLSFGTFILGAIWGYIYFVSPNLLLISISHAIIGLFALSQGLIKPKTFFTEAI